MSATYGYYWWNPEKHDADKADEAVKQITTYCEQNGITLNDIYIDAVAENTDYTQPEHQFMMKKLQPGDRLVVKGISFSRMKAEESLEDMQFFIDNGIILVSLDIPATQIDYTKYDEATAALLVAQTNRCVRDLNMFLDPAWDDTSIKKGSEERGRPKAIEFEAFASAYRRVLNGDILPFQCMKDLGISKSTYYRNREEFEKLYPLEANKR